MELTRRRSKPAAGFLGILRMVRIGAVGWQRTAPCPRYPGRPRRVRPGFAHGQSRGIAMRWLACSMVDGAEGDWPRPDPAGYSRSSRAFRTPHRSTTQYTEVSVSGKYCTFMLQFFSNRIVNHPLNPIQCDKSAVGAIACRVKILGESHTTALKTRTSPAGPSTHG